MTLTTPYNYAYATTVQTAIFARKNFWRFMESLVQESARRDELTMIESGNDVIDAIAREATAEINKERKRGMKAAIGDLEAAYRAEKPFEQLLTNQNESF